MDSRCIVGSHNRWEFTLVCEHHRKYICTSLTAGCGRPMPAGKDAQGDCKIIYWLWTFHNVIMNKNEVEIKATKQYNIFILGCIKTTLVLVSRIETVVVTLIFCVKIQETYYLLHAVCGWFASQHWKNTGELAPILLSPWSALDCKMEQSPPWSIRPANCTTCMGMEPPFNHCSYEIITSNTNEIWGASVVENIAFTCHYKTKKIWQHIIVYLSYGHMVFYRDI